MNGKNIKTAISIMNSVSCDDDASQTVRLWLGAIVDGKMNGKVASPAVAITPIMLADVAKNPTDGCFLPETIDIMNPKKAIMAAIIA